MTTVVTKLIRVASLRRVVRLDSDSGMATAEYAICTIAAAALAAVLYSIVTGHSVASAISGLVQRALSVNF
jgi:hypothetical protein